MLLIGENDSHELLTINNMNVSSRTFGNYRPLRTQLLRGVYSENDPITTMGLKFNAHYDCFDWHHGTNLDYCACVFLYGPLCVIYC